MSRSYTFQFVDGYDDDPDLSRTKGWVSGALKFADGTIYQLYFVTPLRLTQDATDEFARGLPFYAEPNTIMVIDITRDRVLAAVLAVVSGDFIHNLVVDKR